MVAPRPTQTRVCARENVHTRTHIWAIYIYIYIYIYAYAYAEHIHDFQVAFRHLSASLNPRGPRRCALGVAVKILLRLRERSMGKAGRRERRGKRVGGGCLQDGGDNLVSRRSSVLCVSCGVVTSHVHRLPAARRRRVRFTTGRFRPRSIKCLRAVAAPPS
jgi:hypothetical protein